MSLDSEDSGCLAVVVLILLLMFLFWGEPDVFDALREATIRGLQP